MQNFALLNLVNCAGGPTSKSTSSGLNDQQFSLGCDVFFFLCIFEQTFIKFHFAVIYFSSNPTSKFGILNIFYFMSNQFQKLLNNSIFQFRVSMRVFWYITRLFFEKYIFKTLHKGLQNFVVILFEKYIGLRKKN